MSLEFYILRGGQKEGPLSEEEILDSIDLGDIAADDFCIDTASGEKRRVGEVFQIVGQSPPARAGGARLEIDSEPEPELPSPPHRPEKKPKPPLGNQPVEKRPVYFGHPTWLTYWRSLLLATAVAAGGCYGSTYSGYFGIAGWLWASFTLVYVLIDRSTRDYVVTPVRVEVITGLFSKSSSEVRIEDIRAINVRTRGLTGLLGIGAVEFASAGTDSVDVSFEDVWRAHKVKTIVRRIQDARMSS